MAQCRGTTKKGDRCRRDAREGSPYCAIHQDQEIRARPDRSATEWDRDSVFKAVLGIAVVGAIFLFRFRK